MVSELQNRDRSAYYVPLTTLSVGDRSCYIYAPYIDKYPALASMALPKGSPFYEFFQVALLKQFENGQMDIVKKYWNKIKCSADIFPAGGGEFRSMGFEKLNFLFGILCFGYVMSVVIGLTEQIKWSLKRRYSNDIGSWKGEYQNNISQWNKKIIRRESL